MKICNRSSIGSFVNRVCREINDVSSVHITTAQLKLFLSHYVSYYK